jgi:hypothetical protein
MEFGQILGDINYLAVLVAAFSAFFIGWIWYGPLFGKMWMKLNGFSKDEIHEGALPMPVIMGVNYVATLLAALAIEVFIGAHANLGFGIFTGIVIAVFWIATSRLNDVLYERKPMALFWINVGYNFVIYTVMGAILGAWH